MIAVKIIELFLPPIVSLLIVFFGFRHSRKLISIEKASTFNSDLKKNKIQKAEDLIHDLFSLDLIIQHVFLDLSYLVTQTEESDDLEKLLNKNEKGQENFKDLLIRCKTLVTIYFGKYEKDFNTFQLYSDQSLEESIKILQGTYNSKERILNANSIQAKSKALSQELNRIIKSIVIDYQSEIKPEATLGEYGTQRKK